MLSFTINGLTHSVEGGEVASLAQYIREVALLTGTKVSCGEGGCGACIVTVRKTEGGRARSERMREGGGGVFRDGSTHWRGGGGVGV